jgi:hypothetical protein
MGFPGFALNPSPLESCVGRIRSQNSVNAPTLKVPL